MSTVSITRTRPCPSCGKPAKVTWNQQTSWQADYPVREDVTGFDCPTGCQIPFDQVRAVYPTARSAAQPPTTQP